MACSACSPSIQQYGTEPINIQWTVVRGDTAILTIDFLEADEVTGWNTEGWSYKATSYDSKGNVLDDLPIEAEGYSLSLVVPASVTNNWGNSYAPIVAELQFDVRVTIGGIPCDTVWTPIVGTICVLGNVTPGGSL